MSQVLILFSIFFIIRLVFLAISIKNEKRLIAMGATQIGKTNSKVLALAHILYYLGAFITAYINQTTFDNLALIGAVTVSLSFVVLYYIVKSLGEIWTVKVYILPNHTINRSWLFKTFKHPNYFLNIIPELIGIALLCHAWYVLIIGLPIYGVILGIRIHQEQNAMKHLF